MPAPELALLAWTIEAAAGWPARLHRRITHPVVWIGALIGELEGRWNRVAFTDRSRVRLGALCTCLVVGLCAGVGWGVAALLPDRGIGLLVEALVASSLIASRSLHEHVQAVASPLNAGDVPSARRAVALIVGRDPDTLDAHGIARAATESLAENASDGVVAPVLFAAVFGLPGIAAYKAINTLDSMIGHRCERYVCFGRFAARLDDVANAVPARVTAALFLVAAGCAPPPRRFRQDARAHRSPSAGWPEAAMAYALSVRLSGPRRYGEAIAEEPWLNGGAADPSAVDLRRALALYRRALWLGASGLLAAALLMRF